MIPTPEIDVKVQGAHTEKTTITIVLTPNVADLHRLTIYGQKVFCDALNSILRHPAALVSFWEKNKGGFAE